MLETLRGPRGCALSSVQPCPSLGRVPASELGSEGLPERRERRRAQRYARPRPCTYAHVISARGAIRAHTHADTCFRSRCAGIAPSIEFGIITVSIGVVAAVSAAAAPLLVGPTSPLRLVLVAAHVCGFRDHGRDPKERVCPLVSLFFR